MADELKQNDAQLSDTDVQLRETIAERIRSEEERADVPSHLGHFQRMEVVDTLSGGVAHNINNLLMGILGRASLMKAQMDPSHPLLEHAQGIEENVHIAVGLINQLIECTGTQEYSAKPINLNGVLQNAAEMFGRGKGNLKLFRIFDGDLWLVNANQDQLEKAFLKLLLNAWHAMPDGGDLFIQTENIVVDERVAAHHSVEPGRYVKISIIDTGVGMDKDTLKRIFDPFFTTKTIRRGTGLGLSLVYRITINHDGFIKAYSDIDKGTTISICLPAMK